MKRETGPGGYADRPTAVREVWHPWFRRNTRSGCQRSGCYGTIGTNFVSQSAMVSAQLWSSIGRAFCSRLTTGGAPHGWPQLWTRRRARYSAEGLDGVLHDHPQANPYRKLDGRGEAHLIALACSDAPEGHDHWTLRLLGQRLLAGKVVESGHEAVRLRKKTPSNPGVSSSGASPG